MNVTSETIVCEDQQPLMAKLYQPETSNGIAVIINAAMAVSHNYYRHFAKYLCQQGFTVMSYDYRGIGESKQENWQETELEHWYQQDMVAVLNWIAVQFPQLIITTVGHSLGAQLLGLAENNHLSKASLAIASGFGYWKLYPKKYYPKLLLVFYIVMPLVIKLTGKLPGKLLGSKFDVPAKAAAEWNRWLTNPYYMSDKQGQPRRAHFHRQTKMRFISISDDNDFAPIRCIEALRSCYQQAQTDLVSCKPSDYGIKKIGHFGFFRADMPEKLWREAADWLLESANLTLK